MGVPGGVLQRPSTSIGATVAAAIQVTQPTV
jgi:hypothetical protein